MKDEIQFHTCCYKLCSKTARFSTHYLEELGFSNDLAVTLDTAYEIDFNHPQQLWGNKKRQRDDCTKVE